MNRSWIEQSVRVLQQVIACILQMPGNDASRLTNAIIAKSAGAGATVGILGLIASFGTASTGTAIVALHGAAAQTATMYWLGSLVGGGVFAGTLLTGGIGIAVAIMALGWWKGRPRSPENLTEEERRLVDACLGLVKVLGEQLKSGQDVSLQEWRFVLEKAWMPLEQSLQNYNDQQAGARLAVKHSWELRRALGEFKNQSTRLHRATKGAMK